MRSTVATVHLEAIRHNAREIMRLLSPGTRLMAVVKADGYGHGAIPVAKAAIQAGATALGVATNEEALELREAGITEDILVLGPSVSVADFKLLVQNNIIFTVYTCEQLQYAQQAAEQCGQAARIHLKVETGFHRLGLEPEHTKEFCQCANNCKNVCLEGIYTHFAAADEEGESFVHQQYAELQMAEEIVRSAGFAPIVHACATAATLRFPQYHRDMVRLGIGLYGYFPSKETVTTKVSFIPAMDLKTKIDRICTLEPGDTVSYNRTFIATQPSKIAVLPIGYGDGYPRLLSNRGNGIVNGCMCKIAGRVCMDRTMMDVTQANAQPGAQVTLLGREGNLCISAEEIAATCGTISYEILTSLSHRIPRVYTD